MKTRMLLSAAAILAAAPAFAAPPVLNWDGPTTSGSSYSLGGTGTWDNATTNWDTGAAFQAWVAGDIANFAGTAGTVTLGAGINAGGLTFNTSGYTLTGNTLTLAAANDIEVAGSGIATIASTVTGTSGLTLNSSGGKGTLVLTQAPTYTGNTTIAGGTLQIGDGTNATNWSYAGSFGDQSSGAGTLSIAANSTLTITATANNQFMRANGSTLVVAGTLMGNTGTAQSLTNANTSAATVILKGGTITDSGSNSSGYGAFYINGNITFTVIGSGNLISGTKTLKVDNNTLTLATAQLTDALTVSTGLFGSGGIAKTGAGTVTLTGTNTYTGATTIAAGTLNLDFSASGAPASNIINNTALTLSGGGTLLLTGKASTANSQQFNGLSVGTGGGVVSLNANATANPLSLSLGAITRSTGGGVTFILPTGTQSASNGITTTAINDGAGLLGAWAFVSNGSTVNYATVSGGNIVAYTGGTAAADNDGLTDTTGTVNYDLAAATGSTAVGAAAFSANTIRYTGASGTTAPGTSFTVNGLMNAGTGRWTIGTNQLTIGANKELIVNTASADIAITGIIANNAGGASALTKTGTGTLTLSGANTYSGGTFVNGGTLIVQGPANGNWTVPGGAKTVANTARLRIEFQSAASNNPSTNIGTVTLNSGSTLELYGTQTGYDQNYINTGAITGSGSIIKTGTGYIDFIGSSTYNTISTFNGLIDVQVGTLGFNSGTGNSTGSGKATLQIASGATADVRTGTLIIDSLNGVSGSSVSVSYNQGGTLSLGNNNGSGAFAGTLANGGSALSLIKNGTGTQTLSGANTFTGTTTVNAGTLKLTNALALQGSTFSGGVGSLVLDSSVSSHAFTFGGLSGSTNLALADNAANAVALTVGGNNATTAYSGNLSGGGSFTKSGTGILTLSGTNTYAGTTTVTGGILDFAKASAFYNGTTGAVTSGNAALLTVNTGATAAFNTTQFTSADIATLLAASNGTVGFKNGASIGLDTTGAAAPVSQTAAYGGAITNLNSGAITLGFAKLGTGTLVLDQANTYTGTTTVNGGVLVIGAAGTLGTGNTNIAAGTLQVGDGTNVTNWSYGAGFSGGGTLAVAAGSTLTLTATNQYSRVTGAGLVVAGTLVIGQGQAQSIDNYASANNTTTGTGTITLNNGTVTSGGTGAHGTYGGLLIGGSNWTINANGNANVISGVNTVGINNSTLILNTTQATDKLTVSTNILNAGGSGSITKSGAGTVIFTGANTYTGITTVSAGTLLINGTQSAATGAITVAVGATLGGVGTTGASLLTVNGTITGGTAATIGTLTANNVTLTSTGAYVAQIGSSTATADKLAVTGTLTLGGNLTLTDLDNTVVATGTKLTLASYSTITGSFVNAADGSLITVGDNQWRLAYNDALSANTLTLTAVPEPATYGLLGAGALAAVACVRRRRRKMA